MFLLTARLWHLPGLSKRHKKLSFKKKAATASFPKAGVICCGQAETSRNQKKTVLLGVQTASFPIHVL